MPDGVVLLADRWAPAAATSAPAPPIVLLRSPYGRRQVGVVGRLFAERGYQVVIQSCRGTFGSGGVWEPFRHEQADGQATLAWLAEQPWFGGSVYTYGPSYLGLVQWAVCGDPPGSLKAMAPAVTAAYFRDVIYPGNTLGLETMLSWVYQVEHQEMRPRQLIRSMLSQRKGVARGAAILPLANADRRLVGRTVGYYQDWLAHEQPGDPWWEAIDFRAARLQAPPATFLAGWYDIFLPAQVNDFLAMRAHGREARMTIGPWTHTSPGGLGTSIREALAWFDSQRGTARAVPPGVRLFVMGSRRWVEVPDWPPPADVQRWHLHANGELSTAPPVKSAPDRFRFDPTDPTPGIGGPSLDFRNAGRKNQARREQRRDVVTYTSAPMEQDMTVAGPLTADVWFRSSREHTDLSLRLCVVSSKGRSDNLSDGYLRLRPEEVAAEADGTRHVRADMWPTAVTFRRGERVRLQVASSAHPLFARNLGTGDPIGQGQATKTADQEVFHDPEHPSAIELPVSRI
jgi:putative CocE/NonD family hydrolase